MALKATTCSLLLSACYLQLVVSTRLNEQIHSAVELSSGDQGKCELDSAEFYWAYDMVVTSTLALGVVACILAICVQLGFIQTWAKRVAFISMLMGIVCIFLPFIAGNLTRVKVVDRICSKCHCNAEERENVVNQAGLCLLLAMMWKSAVVAKHLGIINITLSCVLVCTRICSRTPVKKSGSGTNP